MLDNATQVRIRLQFERFLSNKIQSIENLSLSDISINPFLMAVMGRQIGVVSYRELARWMVLQRLERGSSTGFGTTLKHVAKVFCNADPLPHMDARLKRDNSVYNLVITSGPKHNATAAHDIQKRLLLTLEAEPNSVPVLGMCYGTADSVGSITKKYTSGVKKIAGRDFWTFLSGDPECYGQILEIASTVHNYVRSSGEVTLEQLIQKKIHYVADELESLHRKDGADFLSTLLGDLY